MVDLIFEVSAESLNCRLIQLRKFFGHSLSLQAGLCILGVTPVKLVQNLFVYWSQKASKYVLSILILIEFVHICLVLEGCWPINRFCCCVEALETFKLILLLIYWHIKVFLACGILIAIARPRYSGCCWLVHINLLLLRHVIKVEHVNVPVYVVLEIPIALVHLEEILIIIHLLVQVALLNQSIALWKKILLLRIVRLLQLLHHHDVSEVISLKSYISITKVLWRLVLRISISHIWTNFNISIWSDLIYQLVMYEGWLVIIMIKCSRDMLGVQMVISGIFITDSCSVHLLNNPRLYLEIAIQETIILMEILVSRHVLIEAARDAVEMMSCKIINWWCLAEEFGSCNLMDWCYWINWWAVC